MKFRVYQNQWWLYCMFDSNNLNEPPSFKSRQNSSYSVRIFSVFQWMLTRAWWTISPVDVAESEPRRPPLLFHREEAGRRVGGSHRRVSWERPGPARTLLSVTLPLMPTFWKLIKSNCSLFSQIKIYNLFSKLFFELPAKVIDLIEFKTNLLVYSITNLPIFQNLFAGCRDLDRTADFMPRNL